MKVKEKIVPLSVAIFLTFVVFVAQRDMLAAGGSLLILLARLVGFLLPVALSVAVGLTIIASGQVFLAIRETAINTRKEDSESTSNYDILFTVAKVNNLTGWAIIIIGIMGAVILRGRF